MENNKKEKSQLDKFFDEKAEETKRLNEAKELQKKNDSIINKTYHNGNETNLYK